jgi:hypothetical protein
VSSGRDVEEHVSKLGTVRRGAVLEAAGDPGGPYRDFSQLGCRDADHRGHLDRRRMDARSVRRPTGWRTVVTRKMLRAAGEAHTVRGEGCACEFGAAGSRCAVAMVEARVGELVATPTTHAA